MSWQTLLYASTHKQQSPDDGIGRSREAAEAAMGGVPRPCARKNRAHDRTGPLRRNRFISTPPQPVAASTNNRGQTTIISAKVASPSFFFQSLMPRRARLSLPGIPWHIIQRGNNRAVCFHAEEDYQFYLHYLKEFADKFGSAA